jgi:protoporphyrinogen oxidase
MAKKAIIIGAGPAGITAAYELARRTDIHAIVYEATNEIGGLSRTVCYKGNRIDVGGHRFFSKSEQIMRWWKEMLPVQGSPSRDDSILHRRIPLSSEHNAPDPEKSDKVLLFRSRVSRILFLRKFFDYPISLSVNTIKNLGMVRLMKAGASYVKSGIFPVREEKSLEDFFINRFGKELYRIFFKDYTEKLWGVSCNVIKPEWGAQRVKGLSVSKAVSHAVKSVFAKKKSKGIQGKNVETSLISSFLYPKFGPGQMWKEAALRAEEKGAEIFFMNEVAGVEFRDGSVRAVIVRDIKNGTTKREECDYLISTMPVKDLIAAFGTNAPEAVRRTADGLIYRDFMTAGILLPKLKIKNETNIPTINRIIPDTWIYIQEPDVKVGRIQIFNNWSPYMVADPNTVWVGMEYFCNEGDELWSMEDKEFGKFASLELEKIGMSDPCEVLDGTVVRAPKAYPAYFGSYDDFHIIREFTDAIPNLFLIGRNGMHRYNNQDHSMLTAMEAVRKIASGDKTKDSLWQVNAEQDYHEEN